MCHKNNKIAVIGGGVAGSTVALYFGKLGVNVTLFEKEQTLISGPPFCHLHAGGNLYREISDSQCITLLKQSIEFLRFYPYIIDYRPTVIVVPTTDSNTPEELLPRLKLLTKEYRTLVEKDSANKVLGEVENYYKVYSKEEILALKSKNISSDIENDEKWMIPVAKNIDLDKVQFPIIMVQEYGLNLFRLSAGIELTLNSLDSVNLYTNSVVTNIENSNNNNSGYKLSFLKDNKIDTQYFEYIVNASGFRTGKIDDMLKVPCKSMVEFKAAYISHCDNFDNIKFPEIIFHGERGTPRGMGQFTPYPNGYFQLHGMTKDITLYEDGLVASSKISCQPKLPKSFIDKIENSWSKDEVDSRTISAIKHLSQFIPSFSKAVVGSKPLFGAQQIPGDDPTLRVAEVSFPLQNYARCEIVKVSSVLDMVYAIEKEFVKLGLLDAKSIPKDIYLDDSILKEKAQEIAKSRNYPPSLANINIAKNGDYYI